MSLSLEKSNRYCLGFSAKKLWWYIQESFANLMKMTRLSIRLAFFQNLDHENCCYFKVKEFFKKVLQTLNCNWYYIPSSVTSNVATIDTVCFVCCNWISVSCWKAVYALLACACISNTASFCETIFLK